MDRDAPGFNVHEVFLGSKHQCIFTKSWYAVVYFKRGFDHHHTDRIDIVKLSRIKGYLCYLIDLKCTLNKNINENQFIQPKSEAMKCLLHHTVTKTKSSDGLDLIKTINFLHSCW